MINYFKDLLTSKLLKRGGLDRNIYAVNEGSYKGEFFVYINGDDNNYYFLSLPHNNVVTVPLDEFNTGLEKKVIQFLEKIPKNVYEICKAQYNESKSKDNINRLKQSVTSSSVDRGKRKSKS